MCMYAGPRGASGQRGVGGLKGSDSSGRVPRPSVDPESVQLRPAVVVLVDVSFVLCIVERS